MQQPCEVRCLDLQGDSGVTPTDGLSLPTGLDHVLLHSDRASGVCMDGPLVNTAGYGSFVGKSGEMDTFLERTSQALSARYEVSALKIC